MRPAHVEKPTESRIRVLTGSGQLDLEEALVREILALQGEDRFARIAVVVPSRSVRLHLLEAIPSLAGRAVTGVDVLHLLEFAERIVAGESPVRFYESTRLDAEALRAALARETVLPVALRGLREFARGPLALASTLRDLRDAGIPPEALRGERRAMATLAEALEEFHLRLEGNRGLSSSARIVRRATNGAGSSPYLSSLRAALYYGLYDLVGLQRELLAAVARVAPTTLFFPLVRDDPSFAFAERSLARIAPHATPRTTEAAPAPENPLSEGGPDRIAIESAATPEDEVALAAKEILRLSREGIPFHRIAVVTRLVDLHLPVARRIFGAHRIPFVSEIGASLGAHPFAKAAAALARLLGSDLPRREVLDLVGSPFFVPARGVRSDPADWERITRRLGISGGKTWERLGHPPPSEVEGETEDERGGRSGRSRRISRSIWEKGARELLPLVRDLEKGLGALPDRDDLGAFSASLADLLDRNLDPSADEGARAAREAIGAILEEDILLEGVEVSREEFAERFGMALEESLLPGPPLEGRGVRVLDPAGARGRTFDALVMIGMDEQTWPRRVREDSLLRDADREALSASTGRPLPLKKEVVEEDRLLFRLLLSSARRRALLVWSRTDPQGRPANPSPFLDAPARAAGASPRAEIPRSLERRLEERTPLWSPDLLTPAEAALAIAWADERTCVESVRRIAAIRPDAEVFAARFETGFDFTRAIESSDAGLERDGGTGPLESFWKRVVEAGVSPSALEKAVVCPFRYFASAVLRLDPLEAPERLGSLGPLEVGRLVHDVLARFYAPVLEGRETIEGARARLREGLEAAALAAFRDWEEREVVGYAVTWESWQERILQFLERVLEEDLDELRESGFAPIRVEADGEATLALEGMSLPVRGRIDRLDRTGGGSFRVIDYKVSLSTTGAKIEADLAKAAIRGERLQPPLYLLLARAILAEDAPGEARFYAIQPRDETLLDRRRALDGAFWSSGNAAIFRSTLQTILDGLREGTFPITPDEGEHGVCSRCDFSSICRKGHFRSRRRAEESPFAKRLAALAALEVTKASEGGGRRKKGKTS